MLLTSCQKGEFRDIDMLNKYILMEETGIGARYKRTDFVTFYSRTRLSVFKAQQEDLGSRSHLLCSLCGNSGHFYHRSGPVSPPVLPTLLLSVRSLDIMTH